MPVCKQYSKHLVPLIFEALAMSWSSMDHNHKSPSSFEADIYAFIYPFRITSIFECCAALSKASIMGC